MRQMFTTVLLLLVACGQGEFPQKPPPGKASSKTITPHDSSLEADPPAASAFQASTPTMAGRIELSVRPRVSGRVIDVMLALSGTGAYPVLVDRAVAPTYATTRPTTAIEIEIREKHTGTVLKPSPLGGIDMAGVGAGDLFELTSLTQVGWKIDLIDFPWMFPLAPGKEYVANVCVESRIKTFVGESSTLRSRLGSEMGFSAQDLERGLQDFRVCVSDVELNQTRT